MFNTPIGKDILEFLVKECGYKNIDKLSYESNKDFLKKGEFNLVHRILIGLKKSELDISSLVIKKYED